MKRTILSAVSVILLSTIIAPAGFAENDMLWNYKELDQDSTEIARSHYNRALYLETQKKQEEAVEAYKKAITVAPNFYQAYNNLGAMYFDMGRHDDAVIELRRALSIKPEYATAHYNLATVYFSLKRYSDAIEEYRKVIELMPKFINAYYFLAQSYNQKEDYLAAINASEKLIDLDNSNVFGHYSLANNLFAAKKMKRARHHYERVLELAPDFEYADEVKDMIKKIEKVLS